MKYVIAILFIISVVWQGGFSDMAWCVAGVVFAVCVFFRARRLPPRRVLLPFAALVLLYAGSFILHGAHFESAAQTVKPAVALLAFVALYNAESPDMHSLVLTAGVIAAVLGVVAFFGIVDFPGARWNGRLQGTFQYANAAGIFFAVCAFLTRTGLKSRRRHFALLFECALLLTQSVGAIATYILGQMLLFFSEKKTKRVAALLGVSAVGCVALLYVRGAGTVAASYLDRLLQMSDGAAIVLHNPLGIGPGLWAVRLLELQSAFYTATKMHSYPMELGVDAGFAAIALFVFMIVVWVGRVRKSGLLPRHIAAGMLLFHGLQDVSLGFLALILLLLLLVIPDFPEGTALPNIPRRVGSLVCLIAFVSLAGKFGAENLAMWDGRGPSTEERIARYESAGPETASGEYLRAEYFLSLGRYDEAAEAALRCIELSRYMPDGYALLDEILPKLPEREGARYRDRADDIRAKAEAEEHPLFEYIRGWV
jgi:tetratricopeptide (TPR) repeat protein